MSQSSIFKIFQCAFLALFLAVPAIATEADPPPPSDNSVVMGPRPRGRIANPMKIVRRAIFVRWGTTGTLRSRLMRTLTMPKTQRMDLVSMMVQAVLVEVMELHGAAGHLYTRPQVVTKTKTVWTTRT